MLDKLLATAANNAKLALAAAAGAALVAGGGAVAITNVADSGVRGQNASESGLENRSDTATAKISAKPTKSPKPAKSAKANNGKGVHGACVSAVAHATFATGREHGKAVSMAAHNCPKGGGASKSPKPAKTGPSQTGQDHRNERATK